MEDEELKKKKEVGIAAIRHCEEVGGHWNAVPRANQPPPWAPLRPVVAHRGPGSVAWGPSSHSKSELRPTKSKDTLADATTTRLFRASATRLATS